MSSQVAESVEAKNSCVAPGIPKVNRKKRGLEEVERQLMRQGVVYELIFKKKTTRQWGAWKWLSDEEGRRCGNGGAASLLTESAGWHASGRKEGAGKE